MDWYYSSQYDYEMERIKWSKVCCVSLKQNKTKQNNKRRKRLVEVLVFKKKCESNRTRNMCKFKNRIKWHWSGYCMHSTNKFVKLVNDRSTQTNIKFKYRKINQQRSTTNDLKEGKKFFKHIAQYFTHCKATKTRRKHQQSWAKRMKQTNKHNINVTIIKHFEQTEKKWIAIFNRQPNHCHRRRGHRSLPTIVDLMWIIMVAR